MGGTQDEHDGELYYTADDLAKRYRVPVETVRHWRKAHVNKGPRWIRIGRSVLYPRIEVQRFDDQVLADAGIVAPSPTKARKRAS